MSWLRRLCGRDRGPTTPSPRGDPARVREVDAVLDEVRSAFVADGGDMRLVWIRGGVVGLELRGACAGCAASALTLELLLRPKLRERCAWFERIERA